jgi:SAM-dependent methyltransferase
MQLRRILSPKVLIPLLKHPPYLFQCEICGRTRVMVRTDADPSIGARCLSCRGTVFHRATFKVLRELFGDRLERLRNGAVYEVSAHGALYEALKRGSVSVGYSLTVSELLDGWTPGQFYGGVRCENLESLTFADEQFDLVTSTGVMEHVENDLAAYAEVRRVLKPGGYYVFTVPYSDAAPRTVIRAKRQPDGSIAHLEYPEYHADPFRGDGAVFTWRNYGRDIVDTLRSAGLVGVVNHVDIAGFDGAFPVVVAQRRTKVRAEPREEEHPAPQGPQGRFGGIATPSA